MPVEGIVFRFLPGRSINGFHFHVYQILEFSDKLGTPSVMHLTLRAKIFSLRANSATLPITIPESGD